LHVPVRSFTLLPLLKVTSFVKLDNLFFRGGSEISKGGVNWEEGDCVPHSVASGSELELVVESYDFA